MADTITVTCPECETTIKTSAEVEGKKVRCKSCGGVFVARAVKTRAVKNAAAKPAPKPAKEEAAPIKMQDDDQDDGTPYGLGETVTSHRCPQCANAMENPEAVVCLHCGYNLQTRQQVRRRKVEDTTAGDVFLWLLPGISCVLGIIALLVFDILYCLQIDEWVNTDAWYGAALASLAIRMWLCIISVFFMYLMGKFAVRRLIFDRVPPEVESH